MADEMDTPGAPEAKGPDERKNIADSARAVPGDTARFEAAGPLDGEVNEATARGDARRGETAPGAAEAGDKQAPAVEAKSAGHASAAAGSTTAGSVAAGGEPGRPAFAMDELEHPGLELLYDVELDATLQFGSKEMMLRDVLELGPGDVVELDRHIAEPVDLVVGDRIVARGEVVVASGNFALRVTEVATPQMRLESIRCLF